jgi:signal peptidase I
MSPQSEGTRSARPPRRPAQVLLSRRREGDGWLDLVAVSLARAYLIFLATLAAIALLPALAGWAGSVVQSGSMQPRVSPGDVVLTVPLPETDPLPIGRVITFRMDNETIVHRIVSVNPDNTLVTAGDANPQVDPWSATRADITGQARLLVPYIGLPSFWLNHDNPGAVTGWLAITLLAVILTARRTSHPRNNGDHDTDTEHGDSDPSKLTAPGRANKRTVAIKMGFATATTLTLSLVAPGMVSAQAASFTGQTRSSASWTAQAYSPITVGAMAGYAAIATTSIKDSSFLFHYSTAHGSVATSPGTTITSVNVDGTTDRNNTAAARALTAASTARTALNQRPTTSSLPATLTGTVSPGTYTSTTGAFTIPTTLTLDAKGDSTARFVFRTTTTLTAADKSRIILTNGAKASNIWWIVGTTATLGSNTNLSSPDTTAIGNYLINGATTLAGVNLTGRLVSLTSTITLYATTITPTD